MVDETDYLNIVKYLMPEIDINQVEFTDLSDGNGVFISKWPDGIAKPSMASLKALESQLLEIKQIKADAEIALKYLNGTDWYVVRKNETGVEIPEEVTTKRAESRIKVGLAKDRGII